MFMFTICLCSNA